MEPKKLNEPRRVPQYSRQEQELIRQLMEARLANHESLEYEVFDDYEVPLSSKLPMLTKPAVSIKYRKMTFSMASIRLFAGVQYVLPILNRKKQRLSIIPLADEESSSVMWARQRESDSRNPGRLGTAPAYALSLRLYGTGPYAFRRYGRRLPGARETQLHLCPGGRRLCRRR